MARRQEILIAGGAGFIGVNAAHRLLRKGHKVTVLDNLSRKGTRSNLAWLKKEFPKLAFIKCDIRDYPKVRRAFRECGKVDVVLHQAAQVAVTTSVVNPREDFEINALGTFNLLEATREHYGLSPSRKKKAPFFLFSSTNTKNVPHFRFALNTFNNFEILFSQYNFGCVIV